MFIGLWWDKESWWKSKAEDNYSLCDSQKACAGVGRKGQGTNTSQLFTTNFWPASHIPSNLWTIAVPNGFLREGSKNQVKGKQQTCLFTNGENIIFLPSTQAFQYTDIHWSPLIGEARSGPLTAPGRCQESLSLRLVGLNFQHSLPFDSVHECSAEARVLCLGLVDPSSGGLNNWGEPVLDLPAKQVLSHHWLVPQSASIPGKLLEWRGLGVACWISDYQECIWGLQEGCLRAINTSRDS